MDGQTNVVDVKDLINEYSVEENGITRIFDDQLR